MEKTALGRGKGESKKVLWGWVLLGVLGAALLVLLGAGLFFFRFSMVRGKRRQREEEFLKKGTIWHPFRQRMEEAQAFIRSHTQEKVGLRSRDGLQLTALYLPAPGESRGTILAFHGYRSLATVDFALEVEFLHNLGYDLLLPYQRSHGESQGRYITYGVKERLDCQDWARYAAQRFGQEKPLFLMGISMGAATVLMASSLDLPENTRGIVADCGFTTPWEIMAHVARRDYHLPAFPLLYVLEGIARLQAGVSLRGADTRQALQKTRLPVLFLHGEADDFVPVSMTRENYAACSGEKELLLVPGAGHAQSFGVDPEGCQEAIRSFLKKHGKGAEAAGVCLE